VVPDNLRSGVTRANRYEPDLNPTYQEMAEHYGVAIIPARPYMTSERVIDMTSETMIDFVGIPINALRNSDKRAILVIIARSFATLLFARQRVSGWLQGGKSDTRVFADPKFTFPVTAFGENGFFHARSDRAAKPGFFTI